MIATVIGILKIAIAKSAGAEWKNSFAWAIIGGLLSSFNGMSLIKGFGKEGPSLQYYKDRGVSIQHYNVEDGLNGVL
jgi:hypothetical protein